MDLDEFADQFNNNNDDASMPQLAVHIGDYINKYITETIYVLMDNRYGINHGAYKNQTSLWQKLKILINSAKNYRADHINIDAMTVLAYCCYREQFPVNFNPFTGSEEQEQAFRSVLDQMPINDCNLKFSWRIGGTDGEDGYYDFTIMKISLARY